MKRSFKLWLGVCAIVVAVAPSGVAQEKKSDQVALPTPADVQSLDVFPKTITLKGLDDSAQLVVTGNLTGGKLQDLSGDVRYELANDKLARIFTSGRIVPLTNGTTEITIRYGDKSAKVPLKTESCDVDLPINFANQIVPIFTKLGCNGGGCHGKSGGQNGFALSLLGFVPELDYQTLVKENRGRRLFPAAPDSSLLLLKAAGAIAHAGGKRMDIGSDEYKLIRRWIASGTPQGTEKDPTVTKISVSPEHRTMTRQNRQQFTVTAHYSDGSTQDVTQRAQYESNDTEIAVVEGAALVRSLELSGEASIMARYQSQVAVFRATVPLGMNIPNYKFEPQTISSHKRSGKRSASSPPTFRATSSSFAASISI
jgi:hypothetical protein